ncbi:phosphotransferase [Shewanella sp. 202IG2-18]|uniref:phosphotransferase n=1 Tax=Parashewanella hymeniacidonis TaxID=2807618 RepID=UPI001960484F|nr:phosphotransferase [Parashewanella hymeniacidonis]MBM7073305.1 phosphotransferase [Parashewanella hymeniacidonis]
MTCSQEHWPIELINFIKECEQERNLNLNALEPQLELIADGLSNKNYLLKTQNCSYVIRENSPQSNAMCNRDNEVICWQTAAAQKLAPALIWFNNDKSYYLSEFIRQPANKIIEANATFNLLNQLQQLPKPEREITSQRQWQIYQYQLNQLVEDIELQLKVTTIHKTEFKQWMQFVQFLNAKQTNFSAWTDDILASTNELQFSHRDLNPDNLLIRGDRLICIDFEYACAAEPVYDIASAIESNHFSALDQQWLTEKYFANNKKASSDSTKVFPAMQKVYWGFFYYWAAIMAGETLKQMNVKSSSAKLEGFSRYLNYQHQYQGKI